MATSRITITIDEDVLAELRSQVGPGDVSAYVSEAIRSRLRKDPIMQLIEQLGDLYGPLTDDELTKGRQWAAEITEQLSSIPGPSSDSPGEIAT